MLSTVIAAETQFHLDTAERDREQHLIASIREHAAEAPVAHRVPRRRAERPRRRTAVAPVAPCTTCPA